jgi:psp operon transcriptional activator
MSLRLQEKLLRVIEYGEFERVGGQKTLQVDVRLVAATNANLPSLADEGLFRWDLLDRLSFDVVHLPPLREREGDLYELSQHFSVRMCRELGWDYFPGFSDTAIQQLSAHHWPGNIRELKNAVERSLFRTTDPERPIKTIIIDPFSSASEATATHVERPEQADATRSIETTPDWPVSLKDLLRETELDWLQRALTACDQRQNEGAKLLGLSYDQMRALMRKHHQTTRPGRQRKK